MLSLPPEATPVFCAIWTKLPLANGRPKKVTVSGLASGSETPTSSVGDVPTPVAALAGALRVGAEGALFGATGVTAFESADWLPVPMALMAATGRCRWCRC